jgi:hypothetical protein
MGSRAHIDTSDRVNGFALRSERVQFSWSRRHPSPTLDHELSRKGGQISSFLYCKIHRIGLGKENKVQCAQPRFSQPELKPYMQHASLIGKAEYHMSALRSGPTTQRHPASGKATGHGTMGYHMQHKAEHSGSNGAQRNMHIRTFAILAAIKAPCAPDGRRRVVDSD